MAARKRSSGINWSHVKGTPRAWHLLHRELISSAPGVSVTVTEFVRYLGQSRWALTILADQDPSLPMDVHAGRYSSRWLVE